MHRYIYRVPDSDALLTVVNASIINCLKGQLVAMKASIAIRYH
jgi:hypothetical protein